MCCFSGRVRSVADTNIFARLSGSGTQFLVYGMTYAASRPVAMLLPLPVRTPAQEDAVRFLSLKEYPGFFTDMDRGFPEPPSRAAPAEGAGGFKGGRSPLTVHAVGDFVASFVPTLDDFDRLDKRFTLPRATWEQIPAYRDYGFAVFQLRAPAGRTTKSHPMAFEFETRMTNTLFFPTVHIHDGKVHATEHFDHALYLQDRRLRPVGPVERDLAGRPRRVAQEVALAGSAGVAARFMDVERTKNIVDGREICFKRRLHGNLPNRDVLIRLT